MTINQRRLIPSTSMLSAFESAARLGSFSRAARELNLTQGAVSRQIHALEDLLDISLFERSSQGISLTDDGAHYAQQVGDALNKIRSATLNLMSQHGAGELHLAILPTLGARWLIPQLPSFIEQNPGITLDFVSKVSPFDFNAEKLDAALHYGKPDWPDSECLLLMKEVVTPIYSPALAEQYDISSAQSFIGIPLLHLSSRPDAWTRWFHAHDLRHNADQGMIFEQFSSIAQAAIAGLGAALIPRLLIGQELEDGGLTGFEAGALHSSEAYYLVIPNSRANYAPVIAFREWILSRVKKVDAKKSNAIINQTLR